MVTLIQDYKNWRYASKNYRKAKADLDTYYDSIIYNVSYPEFMRNLELMKAFVKSLPKDNGQPDYKNDLKLAYSIDGKIFRAGSCFFKLNQVMFKGTLFEQRLTIKDIGRCINNHENGIIFEDCCDGCSHFVELVEYQSKFGNVARLKQERENAKQKLISHFRNTKGKTK